MQLFEAIEEILKISIGLFIFCIALIFSVVPAFLAVASVAAFACLVYTNPWYMLLLPVIIFFCCTMIGIYAYMFGD